MLAIQVEKAAWRVLWTHSTNRLILISSSESNTEKLTPKKTKILEKKEANNRCVKLSQWSQGQVELQAEAGARSANSILSPPSVLILWTYQRMHQLPTALPSQQTATNSTFTIISYSKAVKFFTGVGLLRCSCVYECMQCHTWQEIRGCATMVNEWMVIPQITFLCSFHLHAQFNLPTAIIQLISKRFPEADLG